MRVLFVIALAASSGCSARASTGLSWPRSATREVDGGESLAPRAAARAIAAIVEDDRAADREVADRPAAAAASAGAPAAAASSGTAVTPGASPSTDDPMTTEEIVIEVED